MFFHKLLILLVVALFAMAYANPASWERGQPQIIGPCVCGRGDTGCGSCATALSAETADSETTQDETDSSKPTEFETANSEASRLERGVSVGAQPKQTIGPCVCGRGETGCGNCATALSDETTNSETTQDETDSSKATKFETANSEASRLEPGVSVGAQPKQTIGPCVCGRGETGCGNCATALSDETTNSETTQDETANSETITNPPANPEAAGTKQIGICVCGRGQTGCGDC